MFASPSVTYDAGGITQEDFDNAAHKLYLSMLSSSIQNE
jgi:hypothetical protein